MWCFVIISLSLSKYGIIDSKMGVILNFCSNFPGMNVPYLKSSEQLDHLFPTSLHKFKFHIFQNISKCLIHVLMPFKYNNACGLCDNIQDKYKRGKLWWIISLFFTRKLLMFSWKNEHPHNRKTVISYCSCWYSWFNSIWED